MLCILTPRSLAVVDPTQLKQSKPQITTPTKLENMASCSTWAPDNSSIFIASQAAVVRYADKDDISNIHTAVSSSPITQIVASKSNTVLYAQAQKVHVVDGGKITQSFDSHKATITSISINNDASLLASTSQDACHVHNLALGSHTSLRGIPSGGAPLSCSAFHPHGRTRLLIGSGSQLLVYDTTRPSGPTKTIPLEDNVMAVACSPYSKTLVAVASSNGTIGLVDLDKEKGLFRTIKLPTALSCHTFSACGAFVYLGTETGKLLILDLRALDKTPKEIVLSESGERIVSLVVQRKLKAEPINKAPAVKSGTATDNDARNSIASTSKAVTTAMRSTATTKLRAASSSTAGTTRTATGPGARSAPSTLRAAPTASARAKVPTSPRSRAASSSKTSAVSRAPVTIPKARLAATGSSKALNADSKGTASQQATPTTRHLKTEEPVVQKPDDEVVVVPPTLSAKIKSVLSPVRDPLGNALAESTASSGAASDISVQMETWAGMRGGIRTAAPQARGVDDDDVAVPRPLTTNSAHTPLITKKPTMTTLAVPTATDTIPGRVNRMRTESSASRAGAHGRDSPDIGTGASAARSPGISTASSSSSSSSVLGIGSQGSSARSTRTTTRTSSEGTATARVTKPTTTSVRSSRRVKDGKGVVDDGRVSARTVKTPSPDLPDIHEDPITPVPPVRTKPRVESKSERAGNMSSKGKRKKTNEQEEERLDQGERGGVMDTPAVDQWIEAGRMTRRDVDAKGKGKSKESGGRAVGFKDDVGSDWEDEHDAQDGEGDGGEDEEQRRSRDRERNMSMQLSPRRPGPIGPSSSSYVASPLRQAQGGAGGGSSPHDLLRNIVSDVMYDFRLETRAEMTGLHLDIVRMGRGWRREMRGMVDECVGELRALREENVKLREENERLRRGY